MGDTGISNRLNKSDACAFVEGFCDSDTPANLSLHRLSQKCGIELNTGVLKGLLRQVECVKIACVGSPRDYGFYLLALGVFQLCLSLSTTRSCILIARTVQSQQSFPVLGKGHGVADAIYMGGSDAWRQLAQ